MLKEDPQAAVLRRGVDMLFSPREERIKMVATDAAQPVGNPYPFRGRQHKARLFREAQG